MRINKNKLLSLILVILSFATFYLVPKDSDGDATALSPDSTKETYKVVKVIDGDTIDVAGKGTILKIRLIGINSPELAKSNKLAGCFGVAAKNEAEKYLNNSTVVLENDPSQGDKDKYGSLLRYVYLKDGTSFNKLMISTGFAFEYTYDKPYKYQGEYKQAQEDAKFKRVGFWNSSNCDYINTVK